MSASQHQNLEKVQSNSELINSTLEGYQLTDIGILPEDWELKPLGDLTTLMTNGFVGTAKTHYTDSHDGVIYIQGYNVEENSFNFHGIKRVTAEFNKRHAKSNLRAGDLLMVQTGDVGLVTVVPPELAGSNCHALIISRFKTGLESKFFAYYLNSQQGRNRLKELETGTTMKHINVGDLLYFQVPVPLKVEEQTAIANALSDVDALIQELEKLIAKKQAIKTATMQQLLTGRTRLPQFAHHPDGRKKGYKHSELGETPEDWEFYSVGDISTFIGGAQPEKSTFSSKPSDGYIRLIQIRDYKSDKDAVYIPASLARKTCDEDDIMIGRYGPPIFQILRGLKGAYNVALIKAVPSPKINKEFFYHFIQNEKLFQLMDMLSQRSSGQTGVELPALKAYPIATPSLEEQSAISDVLSDISNEIQSLEHRLNKTRQIKQGMMQELLTGKTRLVKPESRA